ncbi:HAMP domain-containing sensor histidine kinase [Dyadobacter sp. CY347]|uniref:sensor histidine kinase n=1 Tax=Dyadobacter sp. CY347 TaxID=2909336 RepID=UPI001F1D022C|nr:HAMP domain-containing sensor histidine kinase [Dyadobacter sp. CY347]MCF2488933.1 HAMP domain-containing histidine kinase [Dyadobacter sp. CY347]
MNLSFIDWPVQKQLAEESNALNIARIKVLSLTLHLRLITTVMLLVFYILEDHAFQTKRIGLLLVVVILYYIALRLGLNWKKAIHIAILIFLAIIWSNLVFYKEGFHVVTLQYVVIISIYAFYGLGNKWGLFYSMVAILPFFVYMYLEHQLGAAIPWGPVGVSRITVAILLLHNFFFLFLINYYFFNSFYATISALDARTTELTSSLAFQEESQRKLESEFSHQKLLLASISHDIKSPLRFLMATTGRLAKSNPDLPTIRAISQSSYRLYHFMKNLLEYTQFRYRNTRVTFNYLDVHELVDQKFAIFMAEAESSGNTFLNTVSQGVILRNNVQLLSIVLHNLIDNANKVTTKGIIEVTHIDYRDALHLVIRDTGPGMDPAIIRWLNSDAKVPGAELDPESFGMGLVIVKEVSALINARLMAERNKIQGTSIHIIFQK